jgi:ABC-2 type transport system ATP-binding protein
MTLVVDITAVRKTFKKGGERVQAVRGVDLSIGRGETLALLGPNGAGKSTTLDILLGLSRPDSGAVSVLGRHPQEAVDAGMVGAMLQVGALIRDVTVGELIALMAALHPRAKAVDEVLHLVGIEDIASRRTQKLSGGQAQRVRFALALTSDPELLVLDEPTVGMDVQSRRAFWASMRRFAASGKTVVFATHYLEEADAYADRAVLMARGSVVADGPTNELRARVGRRRIRATVPEADIDELAQLPGVATVEPRGEVVSLLCTDSDAAVRALLMQHPEASDIEIATTGLEEAFVELTGAERDHRHPRAEVPA